MIFCRKDRKINLSLSASVKAIIISAASVLFIGLIGLLIFDGVSANVIIRDGGNKETKVLTFKNTVEEVLLEQGITLGSYDKLNCKKGDSLYDDMTIEVYRSMQVYVAAGGQTRAVNTTKRRVADILADEGYVLTDEDMVTPARTKIAKADTVITYVKGTSEVLTLTEEIPYATTQNANNSMARGTQKIVQKGVVGSAERTYRISYADGVEIGREVIEEKVISAPVAEVKEVGTRATKADAYTIAYSGVTSSRSGDLSYSRVMACNATAYDASSCGKAAGSAGYARTATGAIAQKGVVAVDPSVIPLGTRLYIDGYGYAIAADTGGAIKGNKIDLCFNTRSEALSFGRRNVTVYVLN